MLRAAIPPNAAAESKQLMRSSLAVRVRIWERLVRKRTPRALQKSAPKLPAFGCSRGCRPGCLMARWLFLVSRIKTSCHPAWNLC